VSAGRAHRVGEDEGLFGAKILLDSNYPLLISSWLFGPNEKAHTHLRKTNTRKGPDTRCVA
jgi:hypothetical protein